jgi:hypothetical protein
MMMGRGYRDGLLLCGLLAIYPDFLAVVINKSDNP